MNSQELTQAKILLGGNLEINSTSEVDDMADVNYIEWLTADREGESNE